jgi:hypothetical protein
MSKYSCIKKRTARNQERETDIQMELMLGIHDDAVNYEARQEAVQRDVAIQEVARREAIRLEAVERDAAIQEVARQEAIRREAVHLEAVERDAAIQEVARREAVRREAIHLEALRLEALRRKAFQNNRMNNLDYEPDSDASDSDSTF